ncbi:MAG TPA: hypothetical protein VNF68_03695 [Candidatus Baltobacteraceae bacterium]|nr:hypothetical protein [Candidatus Baltobacteraceae bacterium]
MKTWISIAFATLGLTGFWAAPADALPTFAQAYGVKCNVCHTAVPQLNSYGRYVQRTGYAALSYELLKDHTPVTFSESPTYDTSRGNGRIEFGNTAIHIAGYITKNLTVHVHQWFAQGGQPGGLDTLQLQYSNPNMFKGSLHLFAGKLSALPVPAPFSNGSDLTPFASAELTVGEHMYQSDMMRWGASASYVGSKFYSQIAWLGSNADLSGATDYGPDTDKTFQWIAAYADASKPFEAGLYGSSGSYPLAEGGFDRYNTIAAYVQRDPGLRGVPGFFATYQIGNDNNPGQAASGGMAPPGMGGSMFGPSHGTALTLEAYEPLFNGSALVALRKEVANDGLGTISNTQSLDIAVTPLSRYQYLHLYFEGKTQPGMGPAWADMAWWAVPVGR